jgi:hypothetical protein
MTRYSGVALRSFTVVGQLIMRRSARSSALFPLLTTWIFNHFNRVIVSSASSFGTRSIAPVQQKPANQRSLRGTHWKSYRDFGGQRMIDEERDSFDSVLFIGLTDDEEVKLRMGNPLHFCISYDCVAMVAAEPPRYDAGFRTFADYQHASKRVDLVIFGSNTSATAIGSVISRFAHDDAVIVVSPSASITAKDLSTTGCGDGRLLTLRRIGEVQVVGYEDGGGDFGTRVSAKLVSEFVKPLGRVVFGAELRVAGVFKKPETLVGPYFIVAVAGAEFVPYSCIRDGDLVAVDLSNSGVRELPDCVFARCSRLAGLPFRLSSRRSRLRVCCTAPRWKPLISRLRPWR